MKPDPSAMKALLRRREAELQKLMRQMKQDKLHSSPVYKNLEQELEELKNHPTYQGKTQ
jgi:CRISPR/Cas system Type II protein with McrA/HNH and RuvC-like nuclease domain